MKKTKSSYRNFPQIKKLLILFFLFQQFNFISEINAQAAKEYAIKSAFLLRVANFVEWPKNSKVNNKSKEFIIGIYGDTPFDNNLDEAIKAKKVEIKGKKVIIRVFSHPEEIKTADILFICSSEKFNLSKILKQTENHSVLTIGDTKGYAEKGVMINIYLSNGYLKFDINIDAYKKAKFYISSKLLSKATNLIN